MNAPFYCHVKVYCCLCQLCRFQCTASHVNVNIFSGQPSRTHDAAGEFWIGSPIQAAKLVSAAGNKKPKAPSQGAKRSQRGCFCYGCTTTPLENSANSRETHVRGVFRCILAAFPKKPQYIVIGEHELSYIVVFESAPSATVCCAGVVVAPIDE